MNYSRILLGALAATMAYFAIGGLSFALMPQLADEFRKYPGVYRNQEGMKSVMPIGLAAMFVGLFVLGVLYALVYRAGSGVAGGARFGALIGIFAVCVFVLHNYVNLNIGLKLTLQQATVYFIEWTVVGILIGVIYRPKGAI